MADIELVIKISEEMYKWVNDANKFFDDYGTSDFIDLVKNGTRLPKGHGRIGDLDKIIKKMEEREEQLKDDRSMWETACVETAIDMFGETIIEADKSEDKEEEIEEEERC